MPALNGRLNSPSANNNASQGRSLTDHLSFGKILTVVMGVLAVKERWDAHKDRQEDREYQRTRRGAPQLPRDAGGELANPPPYRDNPSAEDIGLDDSAHTRLLDEEEAPVLPRRTRKRNCCVCCGIRCDIVFKALGIVITLYLFYGIYKLIRWARTPSPTGLENMPEYSTSLGCSDAPYMYPLDRFTATASISALSIDLTGGAVGTVFLAQSDTKNVTLDLDLRTDEEPLLGRVSNSFLENSTTQSTAFRLTTPSSASSSDACMRFDLTVHIPSSLRVLSLKSQSLVHVKYDEHASLALSDLTVELLSPLPNNLLLPNEEINAERTTLKMRGGYLVGSLAFLETAEVSTRRGSATTNLKVAPLPAPVSTPDSPARLITSTGSGRVDVTYANPDRRVIASEHTSTGGDMYLTYKQAAYNGRVDVKAKSRTSSGLEGTMASSPTQGGAKEMPWVGDKDGADTMKVKTSGWVGLYF